MTKPTQGYKNLNDKQHKNRSLGSGSYRNHNVGRFKTGPHANKTLGNHSPQPVQHNRSQLQTYEDCTSGRKRL